MTMTLTELAVYAVAFLLGSAGAARMVRLVTQDNFPPAEWLRLRWAMLTKEGKWSDLIECPWCFAPYATAINVTWAVLSNLHWSWWIANVVAASAYLASWIVVHDED